MGQDEWQIQEGPGGALRLSVEPAEDVAGGAIGGGREGTLTSKAV